MFGYDIMSYIIKVDASRVYGTRCFTLDCLQLELVILLAFRVN